MLSQGTQLGPYEILAPLGAGGMGEVHRARDKRLGREVAVKVLPDRLADNAEALALFERELRAVAALSHPNIVVLHDCGTAQGVSYAVMELLDGETLRSRLTKAALSWRPAAAIAVAVADGLAAAHAKGIIHRDLKPENLFLTADGRVKILDFGLARRESQPSNENPTLREDTDPAHAQTGSYTPLLTKPGTVLGTIGYMSPEQVRGETADARSDLFSLGCVLYEMVSGKRPFSRKTTMATQAAILHDEPPDLIDSAKGVPPELVRVIGHCLEKNRAARFHSAHDLAFALRACQSSSDPARRPSRARRTPARPKSQAIDSLAVLPFANQSADAEASFLADGMTYSLIDSLRRLAGLTVLPATSTMRFKPEDTDPVAAGRKLEVRAVLTGTVRKQGDEVLIFVELVDVQDQRPLWSGQYPRRFAGLLALQGEIAREVTAQLRLELTGSQRTQLTEPPTTNLEAFRLCTLGRHHLHQFTEESLQKALTYFHQAIKEDPKYALAYAWLGKCYLVLGTTYRPPKEYFPKGREYLDQALALDNALAVAHADLAGYFLQWEFNWPAAKRELQLALKLDPRLPEGHLVSAGYLTAMDRLPEAVKEYERAKELDPHTAAYSVCLAWGLVFARQYDRALAECQRTLEIDQHFPSAYLWMGLAYAQQDKYEEAVRALQKARDKLNDYPAVMGFLGYTYARWGKKDEADKLVQQLKDLAQERFAFGFEMEISRIHVGLGETDAAIEWLRKAHQPGYPWLIHVQVDPCWDNLHDDPRFKALLRAIGFPESDASPAAPIPKPRRTPARSKGKAIDSIAVLPLVNGSADPNLEYLSDGITESIIRTLSQLPDLRVMARSTVFRFKGRDVDACAVGRELKVRAVLTGRLLQRGDRLIVLAELVNPSNGAQLWGEQYNRPQADLLAVQEEIAREIVERLRPRLSDSQRQRLDQRPTSNTEAYQHYLKGRYYWNKRTAEGMKKSISLFQQAIDLDPTYALAYAGLADTYLNLGGWGQLAPHDAYPRARAAAAKALEIDDTLAEAHCAIAMAMKEYDWDFAGAERAYRRALDLNPSYAVAHLWFGECQAAVGRHIEAIAEFKRALELDPLSLIFNATLGRHGYHFARQYDQAIEQCRKTIEMDPHFWVAHHFLGGVYACAGRLPEAVAAFSRARQLEANPEALAGLGWTYGRLGQRDKAQEVLDELHHFAKTQYISPINFALAHIGLGDTEEAFDWLQKALEHHAPWLSESKVDPFFDSLRSDPRFQEALRKLGFPGTAPAVDRPIDSLAILPLVNAAGDPDMEFLSDGITESLIYQLARLPRLRVMSRNSAFRFKGKEVDAREAGRTLGVQAVLTGRVLARGDSLSVSVELLNVRDDSHAWGERYDRRVADLLVVQKEITHDVVEKLRLRLSGADEQRLAKRATENVEAYQLYLRGRWFWSQFTEEAAPKAIQCFRQALAADPNYALAYAGLSDVYFGMSDNYMPPREAMPLAKEAACKALTLDPTLAEAHSSLALIQLFHELDWESGERGLKRALELNPNLAIAHIMYGYYLVLRHRTEEARAVVERARQLDPLDIHTAVTLSITYYAERRYDLAIVQLRKALLLDPNSHGVHQTLGWNYLHLGEFDQAVACFEKARQEEDRPDNIAGLGAVCARGGQRDRAMKILEELQGLAKRRHVAAFDFAVIHTALGDHEAALTWLRKVSADSPSFLFLLNIEPLFDGLRPDPRFQELLKKLNFPP